MTIDRRSFIFPAPVITAFQYTFNHPPQFSGRSENLLVLAGLYALRTILTLWRPQLPYGYSYKALCARPG